MQNQRLPKIQMATDGFKRSRFNYSHDVNTTADFGTIQPAMCKLIVPGSKTTLNTESLTRLAPMVAPTFGRLKYKMWHQFVELNDVCKTFDALMAQQPTYSVSEGQSFVPQFVPSISLNALTSLCLIGARATIYERIANPSSQLFPYSFKSFRSDDATDLAYIQSIVYNATDANGHKCCPLARDSYDAFTTTTQTHIVIALSNFWPQTNGRNGICSSWGSANSWQHVLNAPLGNSVTNLPAPGGATCYFADFGYMYDSTGKLINNPVSIDSADLLWNFETLDSDATVHTYTIAFRLSSFGKRLRKILIGCGYQLDLDNATRVSMLPLFAYYKAYFNVFGLTQWQDWQQTNCAKLIDLLQTSYPFIDPLTSNNSSVNPLDSFGVFNVLVGFIKDLGDGFITDSADFVSAHLPSTAVSPASEAHFTDVDGTIGIQQVSSQGSVDGAPSASPNGHAYINKINHGLLDEEYLRRLYKWTNRNSVIGRRIAEIIKAQGLGRIFDEVKNDFIGYTEDVVTISDVVSSADTLANGSGASLGEFGGKGVQYTRGKNFSFENDTFGYWITLVSIVPESGYSQQIDPTLFDVRKFDFYAPMSDSLGMDVSYKCAVQGAKDWSTGAQELSKSFGFKPRHFEYKFAQNVTNGDMSLRSTRNNYLPYFLDRFIITDDVETRVNTSVSAPDSCYVDARYLFDASKLPTAGNVWRYPTKYKWLGNLDRIFLRTSDVDDNGKHAFSENNADESDWQYYVLSFSDNFLIHNIFDMQCYAPMLPVEDSFETTDDDEKSNMSVGKA